MLVFGIISCYFIISWILHGLLISSGVFIKSSWGKNTPKPDKTTPIYEYYHINGKRREEIGVNKYTLKFVYHTNDKLSAIFFYPIKFGKWEYVKEDYQPWFSPRHSELYPMETEEDVANFYEGKLKEKLDRELIKTKEKNHQEIRVHSLNKKFNKNFHS